MLTAHVKINNARSFDESCNAKEIVYEQRASTKPNFDVILKHNVAGDGKEI